MGDRDGGVTALPAPHEQERHRLSDDHAAPYDHGVCAGCFEADFLDQTDAAQRRARNESGGVIRGELGHVNGMKAVDILCRVDGFDDGSLVDVSGRRGLDEDAMNERVRVEFTHQPDEPFLRRVGGKLMFDGVQSELGGLLVLGAHIRPRGGILAGKDHGEPGAQSAFCKRGDPLLAFLVNFLCDSQAVNPLHFARVFPPATAWLQTPRQSIHAAHVWDCPR